MILIADSGSTKTTWVCIENGTKEFIQKASATSLGINPVRDSEDVISTAVESGRKALLQQMEQEGKKPFSQQDIDHIYFYGAGCILPYSHSVKSILEQDYPHAEVVVESDMLGAAIALCGHAEGIACILGTGSNSCLFNGERIVEQTPALGFILGDEGSGASLGKRLVGDILKHQLPPHIQDAFAEETGLAQADIINRVYRQPQPNMFLASLTSFLAKHRKEESIQNLLIEEFRRFLQRNISNYKRPDLPIHFVGGITIPFEEELQKAITLEGMKMGQIMPRPITGMVAYHSTTPS